jgi:hypothetical protein
MEQMNILDITKAKYIEEEEKQLNKKNKKDKDY